VLYLSNVFVQQVGNYFMDTGRRNIIRFCSSALSLLTLSPGLIAAPVRPIRKFKPVLLTDGYHKPLQCEKLQAETEYIFHYPFRSTPCFLIDLGKPIQGGQELYTEAGERYTWKGGVGPRGSVVAFSAICAHRMTHPSPAVSFIGYRKQPVGYLTGKLEVKQRAAVIQCCSEQSVYDPAQGAMVLGGPAPQPLAAIELDYRENGEIYATGVYGGDMFDKFFDQFGDRLMLEYQTLEYRNEVSSESTVEPLDSFTRHKIECS
jgi:Rieske Fe-S protein